MFNNKFPNFSYIINSRPLAKAFIKGNSTYPDISGNVRFYQTVYGVIVVAELTNLPKDSDNCNSPIFAFHIHQGETCTPSDTFDNTGTHYNPNNCPHPYHAGDLPPLFSANGTAFLVTLTDRFKVNDIIGKTILLHSAPDDFTTQPAGNSGTKIACGEIVR